MASVDRRKLRGRRLFGALAIVAAACASACSLALDWGSLASAPSAGGDSGGAVDAGDASNEGGGPASDADPGSRDASIESSADGAASRCAFDAGPPMILVRDRYCIDATEVSAADYEKFLTAKLGDTSGQPAVCSWNTTYEPTTDWPPAAGTEQWPVHAVDWCDAFMYCAWAGKRLCGSLDGGTPTTPTDQATEWFSACSSGGATAWPYGNTFDPAACNTSAMALAHFTNVGALPRCVGGFDAAIYDLSGNATEWENTCSPSDASDASCAVHSGSFADDDNASRCSNTSLLARQGGDSYVGIRCCATPR